MDLTVGENGLPRSRVGGYLGTGAEDASPQAAAVANAGVFWRPYYVDRVLNTSRQATFRSSPEKMSTVTLKDRTWSQIRDGSREVVLEGTGRAVNIAGLEVFGKTGTAQNPHGDDNAWFMAYAQLPGGEPEVALAVLVEHGQHGASAAAPIARDIILAAFRDRLPAARPRQAASAGGGTVGLSTSSTGGAEI